VLSGDTLTRWSKTPQTPVKSMSQRAERPFDPDRFNGRGVAEAKVGAQVVLTAINRCPRKPRAIARRSCHGSGQARTLAPRPTGSRRAHQAETTQWFVRRHSVQEPCLGW